MRCNAWPFAPDWRSASGNGAATNGKVNHTFRSGALKAIQHDR